MRTSLCFCFLLAASVLGASVAQAQGTSPSRVLTMASPPAAAEATGTTPAATNTMTLKGRVESLSGTLVGAVVTLKNYKGVKAVTDADGFFSLTVPTTDQPLAVTASYAGYDDVDAVIIPGTQPAVVRLTVYHEIKVRRKNQLKTYLKTANKQVKKQLRSMPRP